MFQQLCASARRKLGQLHFWVLSQRIGVELACLPAGKAGKLLLVPFGDGEGEPTAWVLSCLTSAGLPAD